jgi:hypothetical protein
MAGEAFSAGRDDMSRQSVLSSLVQFDAPLADLKAALALFSWDADPVITLTRRDIAAVLERFTSREIDVATVEEWANLVECREDIRFEPEHEKTIAAAIHDLANPELRGKVMDTAPDLLGSLL